MILTSPSFNNDADIPTKFTCDGGDINPELHVQNVPEEAKSLALIMDDPDATRGRSFTHWLVWNINPETTLIKQESVPPGSVEGKNDFPAVGYGGPCPPQGSAPHHYHFKLYALDEMLDLPSGSSKSLLEAEIDKHLITQAELVGLYGR
ncbi:MAG: YbhB/YbcL family Raf kinase inhibitor-like protein [Patescibacteria group bacterium]|nr:YbhB/YbcL family Raf kinase inhibitor-like protein [Patescibacteria group bacterium]MDE2015617.1 YbhB/YbcL family Raf kinase inhibitor-like protein [Patescibacteria group bacterium]MDE2226674.1 YbhB/YbcL family Raf kinase inhibitor-like protein [Patescibacteria group bacterium]